MSLRTHLLLHTLRPLVSDGVVTLLLTVLYLQRTRIKISITLKQFHFFVIFIDLYVQEAGASTNVTLLYCFIRVRAHALNPMAEKEKKS